VSGASLIYLAEALAAVRLAGWQGLPARLEPGDLDDAPALVTLGSDFVPADLVHLDDPASGARARAWLRGGYVALLEVTWESPLDAAPLDVLGAPAVHVDVTDGLMDLPHGLWIYPARGLAAVVGTSERRVRRLLGFVPTDVDTYGRELQPDLATRRRPIGGEP
jgi:hypothetical protein